MKRRSIVCVSLLLVSAASVARADVEFAVPEKKAAAAKSAPAPAPAPAPEPSSAPGLVLAVLVDNQSLTVAARHRLVAPLRELLRTGMRFNDRVVIASQESPGHVRFLFAPGSGGDAAVAALDQATEAAAGGAGALANTRRVIMDLERSANPNVDQSSGLRSAMVDAVLAESEARRIHEDIIQTSRLLERQTRATVEGTADLVEAIAAMPGRKALLVVSGGLPVRPGEALLAAWRNRFGEKDRDWKIDTRADDFEGDLTPALGKLASAANAHQVTIYALSSPEAPSSDSAETAMSGLWSSMEQATETDNLRRSLTLLTEPTGGLASFDVGTPETFLGELRSDADSYYSLAYTPAEASGENRKVRVELKKPGLRLRYRQALAVRTNRELMIERTRAALLLGWQDNPLDVGIELGATVPGDKAGVLTLPVTVTMPLSGVALVPQGAFHEGRLSVYIASSDDSGRTSPVTEVAVPVRVPNDRLVAALNQRLGYRARLAVRSSSQRLAVSVRDELGNAEATAIVEVTAGAAPAPVASPTPAPSANPGGGPR
jgi:VWFA-related protein